MKPLETHIRFDSNLEVVDGFSGGKMMMLDSVLGAQVCRLILGVYVVDGDHALLH